jgi:hypothetical protein
MVAKIGHFLVPLQIKWMLPLSEPQIFRPNG